ncbi:MAG: GNAT family N-acetyltransferase [Planctomycetaceae bacterium]|nr:GNAT family N-acetyltransferase [Planctomycetaceae bacterium]
MNQGIQIRAAIACDREVLVDFNCRLADETEQKTLDRDTVTRGVQAALDDPNKARYFVACDGERVVGQVMHTWEWSDWRNGVFWWLQSVYVHPDYRGRGVFRRLFEHVRELAQGDPEVVGLRLYVEQENSPAREVYRKLGLVEPGYHVLELPG